MKYLIKSNATDAEFLDSDILIGDKPIKVFKIRDYFVTRKLQIKEIAKLTGLKYGMVSEVINEIIKRRLF